MELLPGNEDRWEELNVASCFVELSQLVQIIVRTVVWEAAGLLSEIPVSVAS